MDPRDPEYRELEALVDRSLKALPAPKAPRTLLPRVMAAVAASEQARVRKAHRPWFTWPLAWQAALIAAVVVLAAAGFALASYTSSGHGLPAPAAAAPLLSWASSVVEVADAAVSVVSIVWQTYLRPIVGYLLAWVVLMSAACATFGLALGRVALGGASH